MECAIYLSIFLYEIKLYFLHFIFWVQIKISTGRADNHLIALTNI